MTIRIAALAADLIIGKKHMKYVKFRLFSIAALLTMTCGCLLGQLGDQINGKTYFPETKTESVGKKNFEDGNHYYLYIESQLYKRYDPDLSVVLLEKALEKDPASPFLLKELASYHYTSGKPEKALEIIDQLVENDPENVESLIIFGKLKQETKDNDGAMRIFEKVLSLDPKQRDSYLLLGGIYLEKNDLNSALDLFQRMVNSFPSFYASHFYLGKTLSKLDRTDDAEKEFLNTLEINPDVTETFDELLTIYEKNGDKKKAIAVYEKILDRDPRNTKYAIDLGYFYHVAGMPAESEALLKSLGEKSALERQITGDTVRYYLSPKKYDAALIIVEGMLKGAPDSSDLNYMMGVTHIGLEDDEKAVSHFQRVRSDSDFYENAIIHMAFIYQKKKQTDKAIELMESALKELPDNKDFLLYLGGFYEETEAYKKAVRVLKKGNEIDPNNPDLLFRLGIVYDKMGKKKASIDAMKKVVDIEPENANALNYLGYTYADLGSNLDEAERLVKEAIKFKPNDGYIIDSLGWVYFKKGRFQEALETLLKAVELVPEDPIILEHLGDAYLKTNDTEKALETYKKSLMIKKDDKKQIEEKIRELTEK